MQKGTAHADGAALAGKVYLWTRRHKHALYTDQGQRQATVCVGRLQDNTQPFHPSPPQPYLVLRDTLCSCEANRMRYEYKGKNTLSKETT